MLDQRQIPLLEALQACVQQPHAAFYAPGHKRGQGTPQPLIDQLGSAVFRADLPELPELDNLFAPQGVIREAQQLAAAAFGAERTWFLVNGSTCGVMAAIAATCHPGEQIILPRNSHSSAISGLIASGAMPIFIQPEYDPVLDLVHCITPTAVAAGLEQYPEAKAVMMVCPTYHGICGDMAAIAKVAHQHQIPLLVDEAHGPHFAFHPDLPSSALAAGADLAVQSVHKVLAAMTQAAMLHVQGSYVSYERISQALQLFQSTSPSYLLLASLDAARQQMALQGHSLMEQTLQLADRARSEIKQISKLSMLEPEQAGLTPGFSALDRTRLTVITADLGLSGFAADQILHQQLGVTAELPSLHHLTFILSLGNTEADVQQLVQALAILSQAGGSRNHLRKKLGLSLLQVEGVSVPLLSPREAFFAASEAVPFHQAKGRISAELICPYPPGIPVLLPGEAIAPVALDFLQQVGACGGKNSGCRDLSLQTLRVVRD